MRHVLILAGPLADESAARTWVSGADRVVCADGGAAVARRWNLKPDWVIGDFDSLAPAEHMSLLQEGIRLETYPRDKDSTDTELALHRLFADHPNPDDELVLLGALGGRHDHELANLMLAGRLAADHRRRLILSDGRTRVMTLIPELPLVFEAGPEQTPDGAYVSLIALSDRITGVTSQGLIYPLNGASLRRGETRGISNEFARTAAYTAKAISGDPARSAARMTDNVVQASLSLQSGVALVFICPREISPG